MIKRVLLPAVLLLLVFILYCCRGNEKVIVLEERDPIVKLLYEEDSLVVYPRDTSLHQKNVNNR